MLWELEQELDRRRAAQLYRERRVVQGRDGTNLYVADRNNNTIRI